MLYPKRRISIDQKFASSFTQVQVRPLFIRRIEILFIIGGQKMKIIEKYIYQHKSQTILNTLAKNSFRNSMPAMSCMNSKIYSR